jgi:hypothetical protein
MKLVVKNKVAGYLSAKMIDDKTYDGYTPSQADKKLAEAKARPLQSDNRGDTYDWLKELWCNSRPNTIAMFIFFTIVLGLAVYGASCIAPTIDPGFSPH